MDYEPPLPRFAFPDHPPSLLEMARRGISDTASVIPASILDEWAVQLPGPGAPLVIAQPELVREVLVDRAENFTRDRFMRRLMRRSWGRGLAAAEGEDWRRQRRAAAPAFRPQAVAANLEAFASASGRAADRWPQGQTVELTARVSEIIADILFRVLVDGGGTVDTVAVARDMPGYLRRITQFNSADLLPLPEAAMDVLRGIPADPAVRRLRGLARRLAQGRRPGESRDDMIALLEGSGPVEDNIRGLFPAAMDTTVAGASWTLYTLALRLDWQVRVAREATACEDRFALDRLPVTRRVVEEVLRLYPPAPMLVRSARDDMAIGGHHLRGGQPVAVSIYAMHRHRRLWQAPDDFDPDRFLPGTGPHAAYMPFGAGPRVCIAAQFALAEIVIVVARILAQLELRPSGAAAQVSLQVTTRSRNGLNVIAAPRA